MISKQAKESSFNIQPHTQANRLSQQPSTMTPSMRQQQSESVTKRMAMQINNDSALRKQNMTDDEFKEKIFRKACLILF